MLFDKSVMPGIYQSFWLAFWHTIIFVIIMVPIAILLPLSLAILINKKPPGYKAFRALIYLPSVVPLTASGVIFTLLFLPKTQNGLIAEFFNGVNKNKMSEAIVDVLLSLIADHKEEAQHIVFDARLKHYNF